MFQEIKQDDKSAEAHIVWHKNTNLCSMEMFLHEEISSLMVNIIMQLLVQAVALLNLSGGTWYIC
jgi:hypothetical protein